VCLRAAEDAARLLAALGHDVDEAVSPWSSGDFAEVFLRVWQTGPAMWPVVDLELLEPLNRAFVERARETSSVEYGRSVVQLQRWCRAIVAFWADYDVVLTPTLALPPVPIGWLFEGNDPWGWIERALRFTPFTPVVNVAGLPAVSLPLGQTDAGVPVGVQLIGRPADEATLLRLSAQVERAQPWRDRRPPAPFGTALTPARRSA
jgi:amidase